MKSFKELLKELVEARTNNLNMDTYLKDLQAYKLEKELGLIKEEPKKKGK